MKLKQISLEEIINLIWKNPGYPFLLAFLFSLILSMVVEDANIPNNLSVYARFAYYFLILGISFQILRLVYDKKI